MNRERLLDVADRLLAWINTPKVDAEALKTVVSPGLHVPIPYPGCTPDFAGLVTLTEGIYAASPDFKMQLVDTIVDVEDCKVVRLLNATGTQAGYNPLLSFLADL